MKKLIALLVLICIVGSFCECKILKENEEYEIVANATITYSYGEDIGWRFTDYDEKEIDVISLSGMMML